AVGTVLLGHGDDLPVGQHGRVIQHVLFVGVRGVRPERPFEVLLGTGANHEFVDGLDRRAAGDFARGMAAHAIGDGVEPVVGGYEDVIFVVFPLEPDIGKAAGTDFKLHNPV